MSKEEEVVDIFDDKYLIDEKSGEQIDLDQFNDEQKSFAKKVLEDTTKFIADSASETGMAFTFPASTGIMIFNLASQIAEGPEIPDPNLVNLFVKELQKQEYNTPDIYGVNPTGAGAFLTGAIAGGGAYVAAMDKILRSNPKLYGKLAEAFPYSVGQLTTGIRTSLDNASKIQNKKLTKLQKAKSIAKGFVANVLPNKSTMFKLARNAAILGSAGSIYVPIGIEAFTTTRMGDSTITGIEDDFFRQITGVKDVVRQNFFFDDENNRPLPGYEIFFDKTEFDDGTVSYRPSLDYNKAGLYFTGTNPDGEIVQIDYESLRNALDEQDTKNLVKRLKDKEKKEARSKEFQEAGIPRKTQMIFEDVGEFVKNIGAVRAIADFLDTGEDADDGIIDLYSSTEEGMAEDAKDKALNEQYIKERSNIQQAPFVTNPNPKLMSMGGNVVPDNILEQANVFEDPSLPEVEVANLFGKVPLWAIQNIDKFKMLTQNLSKAEKKQLESLEKKVGTIEEVNISKDPLDESIGAVSDDVGTSVVKQTAKKEIIDSPEAAESVFYSNLEARLMDPNTPPVFNTAEQFFNFMQQKGISKVEIEDNILTNYIKQAQKNNTPLAKQAMLAIVRQAPQRKIETVTYGFGGDKPAKYPGYQEPGAIDGSYREQVLYLNPSAIPGDPDQLPGSVHDFTERYVIGWSRLTDRNGTIPGAEGLFSAADKKMLATLKKNQTKLNNQLAGLETSALRKLDREGFLNVDLDIDDLSAQEISTIIDARAPSLESIDPALLKQIRQFKSKLQDDLVKIQNLEKIQAGSKVIVTFADEIQSDILQQAKKLELDLKEQISDLMDLPLNERMARLARDRLSYQGKAREVEPQVLEYYTRNETIFRPMFKTAEDMQQFVDEFRLNKKIFEDLAKQGPSVEPQLLASAKKAAAKEKKMLEELDVGLSDAALKQLFPNVPFKNRMEWGSALIKRDIALAAKRLFVDKDPNAGQWYAVTPAKFVKNRYSQSGGTNTPINERTSDMKGIGTEEFYGGPDSTDFKGKHYTSTVEKILKRAAKDNNSEFKVIEVDGVGEVFAIKITPEMLLPHKTHRKRGGLVYTPETIIDIFEAA
jgi:hypothetical protein